MTDKQWDRAIAQIKSYRYQLTYNSMPMKERRELRHKLLDELRQLADGVEREL